MSTKEMAAKNPADRLEDDFRDEVQKNFSSMMEFKKFARSRDGLCLKEHDIEQIEDNIQNSVDEQKMKILNIWRVENGEKATVWQLRFLVEKYHRIISGDQAGILKLGGGMYLLFKKRWLNPKCHIYLGEDITNTGSSCGCAIKMVQRNKENEREPNISSTLPDHENVISVKHVGIYESFPFDYNYIVMDLSWTRNLRDLFEESRQQSIPFDEPKAKKLAKQLLKGLHFIHEKDIIHVNLKPENMLVSDDNTVLKITGFGTTKRITDGNDVKQPYGTDGYRAPETYENEKITLASNVFSAGIIIAEILSNGRHPFGDDPDLWKYHIKNDLNLDLGHLIASNLVSVTRLLQRMLLHEPEDRPTAKEVVEEDALETVDSDALDQESVSLRASLQVATPEDETLSDIATSLKAMLTQFGHRMVQDPTLLKNTFKEIDTLPEVNNFVRAHRRSTSTGKEIILFGRSSGRFGIYRATKGFIKQEVVTKVCRQELGLFNVAVSEGYLYVFSMMNITRVKYLDPRAEWSDVTRPSTSISTIPSVVVLKGSIYICGGSILQLEFRSVDKYDEEKERWIPMNQLKVARSHPCLVATEDFIYCIGGQHRGVNLRSIERFDPTTQEWNVLDLILPRTIRPGAKATALKHLLYIVDDKKILCCDTQRNVWTELDLSGKWPFVDSDFSEEILTVNEEVYLVGSTNGDRPKITFLPQSAMKGAKLLSTEEIAPALD